MSATLDLQGSDAPLAAGGQISSRWLFRIVDVGTGRPLIDGAGVRQAVDVLESVESIFDVWIFVSTPRRASWRQLSPGEHRILWNFRGR